MAGTGYEFGRGYHKWNDYAGNNRRVWTLEEDTKLVDALMELHDSGEYVGADIKPDYVHAVQRLMGTDSFYKAKNVKGRMKTMKTNFNFLHDMLVGTHMSGFSWEPKKSCVIADNQTHTDASAFRNWPFPNYDELCIIFGKDRAKCFRTDGLEGEGVVGENQIKSCVEAKDVHVGGDVLSSYGVREGVSSKRKRDEGNDFSETCVESSVTQNNKIEKFGRTLSEGIYAANDTLLRWKIYMVLLSTSFF